MMYIVELEEDVQAAFVPIRWIRVDYPELFLNDLKSRCEELTVQAVDARYIAGPRHLEAVVKQAWEASRRAVSRVKKLEIDILMRVACDSRASEALKTVGLSCGVNDVVFVAVGDREAIHSFSKVVGVLGEPSDELIRLTCEKEDFLKRHHRVGEAALKATLSGDRLAAVLSEKAVVELSKKG